MIRINEPTALGTRLLVCSDLPDRDLGRQEVAAWAASSGYTLPQAARSVAVYENERVAREWMIIERTAEASSASPHPAPCARRKWSLRAVRNLPAL